jgi:DNA polymerase III sliding clamp (beta) subunit (PCNA family)
MDKQKFMFLLPAIGKDDSRKCLTFVHFKVDAGRMEVTAANAYLVKWLKLETDIQDGEYFLDETAVKQIIKLAGKNSIIIPTVEGMQVEGVVVPWSKNEHAYPDLSSLKRYDRSGSNGPFSFGMTASMMELILKGSPSETVKVTFKENNYQKYQEPIYFEWFGFPEYHALLMPVRLKW